MMRRYLTEDEQQRLLKTITNSAAAHARRDSACIRLLRSTGLRVGEFTSLTVGDARDALRTRYLFIPRVRRKGGKQDHSVLVTREAEQALRDLLALRADAGTVLRETDPLVLSRKGGAMTVRAWQHRFKVWARAAGLPDEVSPHWMRHTRGMNIMRRSTSNDPRGIVQAALGHASISSTGIYTQPSREEVEAQLEQIDDGPRLRKRDLARWHERRAA